MIAVTVELLRAWCPSTFDLLLGTFRFYLNLVYLRMCLCLPSDGLCLLHLFVLADRDGADIVFVSKLRGQIMVDLHLVVLADKDGAYIEFLAQLRRGGCSRLVPRRPCG